MSNDASNAFLPTKAVEVTVYAFELEAIVKRSAERIKNTNNSHATFLKVTSEEVVKTGIKNESDLKRITKLVRQKLSEHSGVARSRRASARKTAAMINERIHNG